MKNISIKDFTKPLVEEFFASILPMRWENPKFYGDFLAQTYYHICHTTRLLAAAGSRFDISHDKLHLQCMKHAGEERSHERLSTSDLKELGFKLENFSELPSTKALYRNAYYLVDRSSPLALFGYAYFLECVGAGGILLEERLTSAYGAKAVKHLSLHAHEDPGHIQSYEKMLDEFKGEERKALEESILSTAYHYKRIYQEIEMRASTQSSRIGKAA